LAKACCPVATDTQVCTNLEAQSCYSCAQAKADCKNDTNQMNACLEELPAEAIKQTAIKHDDLKLSKRAQRQEDAQADTADLDQIHMPDPILFELARLNNRIKKLEATLQKLQSSEKKNDNV
jgi:hypothetical protein